MTLSRLWSAIGLGIPVPPVEGHQMVRCPMCELAVTPYDAHIFYIGDEGLGWHGRCFARRLVELGIPSVEETLPMHEERDRLDTPPVETSSGQ